MNWRKFSRSGEATARGSSYFERGNAEECAVTSEKQFNLLERNSFFVPEARQRVQSVREAISSSEACRMTS